MVLRRPYAFLIKYFKIIHLLITAIFAFLVVKTRGIYIYLNSVIKTSTNRYDVLEYVNYGLLVVVLLALLLCFAVYWLLKFKDKPRRLYIFIIGGYIIIGIYLLALFGYMGTFLGAIADNKTLRFYKDIMIMIMVFQYYSILVMAIRGFGFDIKKFDFNKDLQELNAEASDSEEVEINTTIDTTNIARGLKKGQRELGYYVKEFKPYVIAILAIVVIIIGIKSYNFITTKLQLFHEEDYIGGKYVLKIADSYYSVIDGKNYVIVSFDIFKNGKREPFNINNMALKIGKNKYYPDKTICSRFRKLGQCYKGQNITEKETNYLITYQVDKLNIKKTYIIYSESFKDPYKVKLTMKEN